MFDLRPLMAHLRTSHGAAGNDDLAAVGLDRWQVDLLVQTGLLRRVSVGTYVCPAVPGSTHQRIMTAIAAARRRSPDPALVGAARDTAAWLWGLVDTRTAPSTVHLVVPHARTPAPDLPGRVVVHRSRTLTADDLAVVDDVPATTPRRTIVDLAINHGVPHLTEVTSRGLQLDLVDLPGLSDQLRSAGRIRGGRRLAQALSRLDPDVRLAQSRGEQAAFAALSDAGFEVVRQHPVTAADRSYRTDLFLPDHGLAVEGRRRPPTTHARAVWVARRGRGPPQATHNGWGQRRRGSRARTRARRRGITGAGRRRSAGP